MRRRNVYGAFLVVLCGILGMSASSLVHNISIKIPAFQMLFLKAFSAFVVVLCCSKRHDLQSLLASSMKKWHLLKAIAGLLGNVFWIIALQRLPLADCAALALSSTVFTALGGLMLFGERNNYMLWVSLALGFCGVLMILKPSFTALNFFTYFPVFSALFFSVSTLIVKKVSLKDASKTTLLYLMGFMSLLSLGPALYQWVDMSWLDFLKAVSVGGLYAFLHLLLIEAYTRADASFISPFKFIRFPLNVLSGFIFFAEVPSLDTLMGASIIIAGAGLMLITAKYALSKQEISILK